jgi:predicted RNase H-like HicB family nuclease
MTTYTYTVHIEPEEDGGYVVTVPALPGCVTQGETYEGAVAMAQEAVEGFLEALAKAGEPIPREAQPTAAFTTAIRVRRPSVAV